MISEEEMKFPREPGKLNIYFHVSENSGVGYYRQYLAAAKLLEKKLANVMISDFRWGIGEHVDPPMDLLMKILNWADIVVVGRKDQGEFYASWGALKEFFKIPIVMDTDDNVQHVRPSNPGYQGYHPGSEAITWNKHGISKVFDAITVSTQNLVEFYKKYNPKIFHLANNLDVKWWDSFEKKQHEDGLIRIGFIASAAHPEGVRMVKSSLVSILKKHPNVRLLITNLYKPIFDDTDVKEQVEAIPWIKLEDWAKEYKALGLDIGIAPLTDNMFNRAKSNLRWLEYSVQKVPAVVSPVEAYSCVRDGVDALVAKEKGDWETQLERLITDPDLRKKIGEAAYERVSTEFNIDLNIEKWLNVYTEIHARYKEYFGEKNHYFISKKGLQQQGERTK